jgi:hypothetical protein
MLYVSKDKLGANDSLEGMLNEAILAYCEVISRHLSGRLRKSTKNLYVRITGLRPVVLTQGLPYTKPLPLIKLRAPFLYRLIFLAKIGTNNMLLGVFPRRGKHLKGSTRYIL